MHESKRKQEAKTKGIHITLLEEVFKGWEFLIQMILMIPMGPIDMPFEFKWIKFSIRLAYS